MDKMLLARGLRSRGDVADLISMYGDEETGTCGTPGPQKPNGLITMPVETGGCELHEGHPLDDRLNGPAFTSSPFVTREYVALGRRSSALWYWAWAPAQPTALVEALPTPELGPGPARSSRPDLVEAVQVRPYQAMRLPTTRTR